MLRELSCFRKNPTQNTVDNLKDKLEEVRNVECPKRLSGAGRRRYVLLKKQSKDAWSEEEKVFMEFAQLTRLAREKHFAVGVKADANPFPSKIQVDETETIKSDDQDLTMNSSNSDSILVTSELVVDEEVQVEPSKETKAEEESQEMIIESSIEDVNQEVEIFQQIEASQEAGLFESPHVIPSQVLNEIISSDQVSTVESLVE